MKTIKSIIHNPKHPYQFPQPIEEIAFFDIETTGLFAKASSIYLIGLMYFDMQEENWVLIQWFADNYQSEKEILISFLDKLSSFQYLYHFNGRTFDIPFVLKKCQKHAVAINGSCNSIFSDINAVKSIDLLAKIRPLKSALMLEKCNQTALEQWLGIHRSDTFDGGELISVYSEYMQQKILQPQNATALEKVLLLHNHDDIEMMLEICSMLTYSEYLSLDCTNRFLSDETIQAGSFEFTAKQELSITLPLPMPVPKKCFLAACYPIRTSETSNTFVNLPPATLLLENSTAMLKLPVYDGILKFFFSDYKNYYYLPKEDMAIHKSIAEFVDSDFRKKATASTAYVKKEGSFLPSLYATPKTKSKKASVYDTTNEEIFYFHYKDKLQFFPLPKGNSNSILAFWKEYLRTQFASFR